MLLYSMTFTLPELMAIYQKTDHYYHNDKSYAWEMSEDVCGQVNEILAQQKYTETVPASTFLGHPVVVEQGKDIARFGWVRLINGEVVHRIGRAR